MKNSPTMRLSILLLFSIISFMCHSQSLSTDKTSDHSVHIVKKTDQKKVEVYFDADLFTAYIYPDHVMKPVLWPVYTTHGTAITRQFPLAKAAGERTDHPHHVGIRSEERRVGKECRSQWRLMSERTRLT